MIIQGIEYVTGLFRGDGGDRMATHLYQGSFHSPGFPMCTRGWNRRWYDKDGKIEDYEYSIFRNNISEVGICKVCLRRANLILSAIEIPPNRKPKK